MCVLPSIIYLLLIADKGYLLGGGSPATTPKKGEVNIINKEKEAPIAKPPEKSKYQLNN